MALTKQRTSAAGDSPSQARALCSIHERNVRILTSQVAHFGLSAPAHLVVELEREARLLVRFARASGHDADALIATARALLDSSGLTGPWDSSVESADGSNARSVERVTSSRACEFDAFVCYARLDEVPVLELKRRLQTESLRIWIDVEQIRPGDAITERIELGLRTSSRVLACLSRNSVRSSWARSEYGAILKREIEAGSGRLIPVLVGDIDEDEVPLLLGNLQRIDARTQRGVEDLVHCLREAG